MAIQIKRNRNGNCIQFSGSSHPAYFNDCLTASPNLDDPDRIDITNDARSEESGKTYYEFYGLLYTDLVDDMSNPFADRDAAVDYVNSQTKVDSNISTIWFDETTSADFTLDVLNNTILVSNGDAFAVNSVMAVRCFRGQVSIVSSRGSKVFYSNMYQNKLSINGVPVSLVQSEALAQLNALFTRTSSGTPPNPPVNTIDDEVGIVPIFRGGVTTGAASTGVSFANLSTAGYVCSSETISEPGEFFKVSGLTANGDFRFGLTSKTPAEIETLLLAEDYSSILEVGLLFNRNLRVLETTYGADLGGFDTMAGAVQGTDTLCARIRDPDGRIAIHDANDINVFRAWSTTQETEYRLVILAENNTIEISNNIEVGLVEATSIPTAPYSIESPDGVYSYPLYRTAAEANYISVRNGGPSSSSARSFIDEPTSTTWYSPTTGYSNSTAIAPVPSLLYVDIATEDDGRYIPVVQDVNVSNVEGTALNINVPVTGEVTTVDITGLPAGLVFNRSDYSIIGTTPVAGTYAMVLTFANMFGSSTSTVTLTSVPDTSFVSTRCLSITGAYNVALTSLASDDNHPFFNPTDDVSVNMWINIPSVPTEDSYLLNGYGGKRSSNKIELLSGGTLLVETERNGDCSTEHDISAYCDGQWHLLTVNLNGPATDQSSIPKFTSGPNWVTDLIDVFIDGVDVPCNYGESSGTYKVNEIWKSKSSHELRWFNKEDGRSDAPVGIKVDDIAVYTSATTLAQALTAYNSGDPIDMTTVNGSNLYYYWQMGDNSNSLFPSIQSTVGTDRALVLTNMAARSIVNK